MQSLTILSVSLALLISFNNCNAAYKKHVLAIGQALVDVSVKCDSNEELEHYIQGISITKGDSVAIDSSVAKVLATTITSPTKQSAGGAGANIIAGLASLGAKVGMVSTRANDSYGNCFDQEILNSGAEHFCCIRNSAGTGVVYLFITPDGERTMLASSGVSHQIDSTHLQLNHITEYEMLLSEGYMWYSEHAANVVDKTFSTAHQAGTKTVFTLSAPSVAKTFKKQFINLCSNIDIMVGNEEEFCNLCSTINFDDICTKMQTLVPMSVITRGADGAVIVTRDEIIHVPVQSKVTNVVDTTGAGDMFLAGFLYGQTHGMGIIQSAKLGNALAGRLIQQIGARPEFDTKEILRTM